MLRVIVGLLNVAKNAFTFPRIQRLTVPLRLISVTLLRCRDWW